MRSSCAAFAGESATAGAALRVLRKRARGRGAFAAAFATAFAEKPGRALDLGTSFERKSPAMLAEAARVLAAAGLCGRAAAWGGSRRAGRSRPARTTSSCAGPHLIEHLPRSRGGAGERCAPTLQAGRDSWLHRGEPAALSAPGCCTADLGASRIAAGRGSSPAARVRASRRRGGSSPSRGARPSRTKPRATAAQGA